MAVGLFDGQRVLITGGTGSLGRSLIRRLLEGEPERVTVLSRDESKQDRMRHAIDDPRLAFLLGDVRDYPSVARAAGQADVIFNAAALKQVPSCEYQPWEAARTNIEGAANITRAIAELDLPVRVVVGISTDKACKPVNVMGMTKALQERIFIRGNLDHPSTRFIITRYGNVLGSRGSVVPLFLRQIELGGPLTITTPDMTRFLLTLDDAVDTVFAAVRSAQAGETYIPRCPSARIVDIAAALVDGRPISTLFTGIRPGEKVHEVLVSEEEAPRTLTRDGHYVIRPMLPELGTHDDEPALTGEFCSADHVMAPDEVAQFLGRGSLAAVA